MPVWRDNTIMLWYVTSLNGSPVNDWVKITDHNRSGLSVSVERLENKQRMVDGTLRKNVVAKKRSFSCSWAMLPSVNVNGGLQTADGGWPGEMMETFHNETDGPFQVRFRRGNGDVTTVNVMISDFSKEVVKRGNLTDLWNLDITLEEV